MSILDYRIGPANKTLEAMQSSDPEVAVKAEEVLQTQEPTNQDQNFFQRLLNFVNPFSQAGAAEPNNFTSQNLSTGFNTVLDSSGNIQIVPVQTNNDFPFKSMTEFAQNNNMVSPASVTPFNPRSIQSIFPTNFPAGVTQSTAAQEFKPEPPFQIIGGQKVYLDDVLGIKAAEEKSNMFTPKRTIPQLTMDTVSEGIKSLVSKFAPGMSIANMLDKFDSLPYMDRKFIKSRMAKVGKSGGDFYVDPKSGLFKDKAGLGIRSLRGNYAKTIDKEFLRYDKAVKRAEDKYGVTWDGTKFVGENAEIANKRNRRNIDMFKFFRDQKTERDRMRKEIIEKAKKQKSPPIQRGFPTSTTSTSTGDGGPSALEIKASKSPKVGVAGYTKKDDIRESRRGKYF